MKVIKGSKKEIKRESSIYSDIIGLGRDMGKDRRSFNHMRKAVMSFPKCIMMVKHVTAMPVYTTVCVFPQPESLGGFSSRGRSRQPLFLFSLLTFQELPLLLFLLFNLCEHLLELGTAQVQRVAETLPSLSQQPLLFGFFLFQLSLCFLLLLPPICYHLGHFSHVCSNQLLSVRRKNMTCPVKPKATLECGENKRKVIFTTHERQTGEILVST